MKTLFFQESPFLFVIITIIFLVGWYFAKKNRTLVFTIYIILLVFLFYFYRVPSRQKILREDALVAASDGTIKQIIYDPEKNTYRIVTFLHIFNQHLQFYPISGIIKAVSYKPGSFHPAYFLEKSKFNERMETIIDTKYGDVKITQIAGQIARRIVNHSEEGESVEQGDYLGMIKLSSRVDIEFSATSFVPNVKVGDILYAQETIIATKK